jgi:hypothetical protein
LNWEQCGFDAFAQRVREHDVKLLYGAGHFPWGNKAVVREIFGFASIPPGKDDGF